MSSENDLDFFMEETSCKGCPRPLEVFGDKKVMKCIGNWSSNALEYVAVLFFKLMLSVEICYLKVIYSQDFYCMCQLQLYIPLLFSFRTSYSWQVNLPGLEDPCKPLAGIIHMHVEHGFCEQSLLQLLPFWGLLQEYRRGCSWGMVVVYETSSPHF